MQLFKNNLSLKNLILAAYIKLIDFYNKSLNEAAVKREVSKRIGTPITPNIKSETVLSQEGDCWIYDSATVSDNAVIECGIPIATAVGALLSFIFYLVFKNKEVKLSRS